MKKNNPSKKQYHFSSKTFKIKLFSSAVSEEGGWAAVPRGMGKKSRRKGTKQLFL